MKQLLKFKGFGPKREHELLKFLATILTGVFIANFLIYFVIQGAVVNGYSMYPTYNDSEYIFVDKISWKLNEDYKLDRFDVIVCRSNKELIIKRIIGLPGEKVHIDINGKLFINDKQINDPWGFYKNETNLLAVDIVHQLGEGEYFVCGDNRNGSLDSRYDEVGNIQEKDIIGRVINLGTGRKEPADID